MGEIPQQESEKPREPFDLQERVFRISEYGSSVIKELKSNPNKLVREESMIDDSIDKSIVHYSQVKTMFKEMADKYGVSIPDMDMVIGEKKKGEKKIFTVVDKIEGCDLKRFEKLSEAVKDNFESFYLGYLQSILDAYKERKPFFNDFAEEQIMYGHKSADKDGEDKFFLVDVGTGFTGPEDVRNGYTYYDFLLGAIEREKRDIKMYEKKFGQDCVLHKARQKIEEIENYFKNTK